MNFFLCRRVFQRSVPQKHYYFVEKKFGVVIAVFLLVLSFAQNDYLLEFREEVKEERSPFDVSEDFLEEDVGHFEADIDNFEDQTEQVY